MAGPPFADGGGICVVVNDDLKPDVVLEEPLDRHFCPTVPPRRGYDEAPALVDRAGAGRPHSQHSFVEYPQVGQQLASYLSGLVDERLGLEPGRELVVGASQCLAGHVYHHYRHLSRVEVDAHHVGRGRVDAERPPRLSTSRGYGAALLHDAALYQSADYDRYRLGGEPRTLCDLDAACPFRHLDRAEHDVDVVGADPGELGTAEHWPALLPSRSFDFLVAPEPG